MTTYDFNLTRNEICEMALSLVGALPEGEVMTADQLSKASKALNSMVKRWQNDHIHLWTEVVISQALSASTSSYALSSNNIVSIEAAFRRETTPASDVPLRIISWLEYQEIYKKAETGPVTHVCLDNQRSPTLYVYPTPDSTVASTYSLRILGIKKLADFDASTDNPDFPTQWLDALIYGLAESMSDHYALSISERQWLQGKAADFKKEARRSDRENTSSESVEGAY